ncbi:MAG: hypothetical protein IT193_05600 [Propionibacteriaceae bacterium]|nr:hypothetical protein [Propionibacteriaceae bacterium]
MDPWAWLHTIDTEAPPDYSSFHVVAGVLPQRGEPFTSRCRTAVEDSEVFVEELRDDLPPDVSGDWIWVLPDDAEPGPDTLPALLDRVRSEPDAAVIGALLIEPRRRGAGTLVSDWAQTISGSGRLRPLTEPGELYQGQLKRIPALGVPAGGMLVRGDAWRFLGGFNPELPRSHWGLDLGWRANLAGYRVLAEPKAQLVDHSLPGDPATERAAGLALVAGHAPGGRRWLTSVRLVLGCLLAALGFLLGKDPERATEELRGLGAWLSGRRLRHSVADQVFSLPTTEASRAATKALRPPRWAGMRRAAELLAARLSEWALTFTGRSSGVSLDELTGDDFADTGTSRYRLPLAATGLLVLVAAALVAGRTMFGTGSLTGAQLLAAQDGWLDLVNAYVTPVPGTAAVAATPWSALTGLFSLLTVGRPEWLVTGTLLLAVPLAWLLAFRLLRQVVADRRIAGLGALAYALAAALIGGLNVGAFGLAATSILLPMLGYSAWRWLATGEWSWRRAGAVAFWLVLACSLVPLFWVPAALAALLTAIGSRRLAAWAQWAVVLLAPALLCIGPWGLTLLEYPGRLLTGIEPALASTAAAEPWSVLIGHTLGDGPPLWISICFFAVCWIAALVGAVRRPEVAGRVLAGAGLVALVAIGITRLVVEVPPGTWARPQALEWQLALVAALVLAAGLGLDGIAGELQARDLGLRHLAGLGLAISCVVAVSIGAGWWLWAGQTGLSRAPVGSVPAFVRNAQVSPTPGRTLALVAQADQVNWALLEGDFARLGDAERGTAFGGDAAAKQLAASVAARLVGDSADDQLLPDLVSLGVAFVSLAGGDSDQRMAINNVPGLGLGTGDALQYIWPVPNAAIATLETSDIRIPVGNGTVLEAGSGERVLRLAQPPDPRWNVRVGDTTLQPAASPGPGTAFTVGTTSGDLSYRLVPGSLWWAWVQLAGLVVLAVLAAPSVRRRNETSGPRRMAGAES